MQPIKILNSMENVLVENGKIKLTFDIVSKRNQLFNNCCFKVICEEQVVRHDMPSIDGDVKAVSVEFDYKNPLKREMSATCQVFQGDRIICSKEHTFALDVN